jgi:molybdopterin synthase catalytic subunit
MSSNCQYQIIITSDPLTINAALNHITAPCCGGTSIFCGTTRDTFQDKTVLYLEYEAYKPMAVKEIERICDELTMSRDVRRVYVAHRTGRVDICETSIIVAASSPHRNDAITFVAKAVDEIKKRAPVWKKEWYEDGSVWKENCRSSGN